MVAEAQRSRAPIQRMADKFSGWFVPVVIAVALIAATTSASFGPDPRLTYALVAVVSVLIIACPCPCPCPCCKGVLAASCGRENCRGR